MTKRHTTSLARLRLPRVIAPITNEPLFWAGTLLRLAACLLFVPDVQATLFAPFMRETLSHPSLDPWSQFIESGGSPIAFPYGAAMYLALLPTTLVGMVVDGLATSSYFSRLGFSLGLFTADFALLCVLSSLFRDRRRDVLLLYWLSPIVLYVTYYHGQIDIIPTALLVGTLLALKERRPAATGILFGLSISAKISMVIAAPFLFLYVWNSKKLAGNRNAMLLWAFAAALVTQGLLLLSPGLREMIFASPEIARIYQATIPFGSELRVYLLIVVYVLVLYWAFTTRRMNFDLLFAYLGVAFLIVLTVSPAATGWFLWCVPFLVGYQMTGESQERPRLVILGFSLLYLVVNALTASGPMMLWPAIDLRFPPAPIDAHSLSLLISLLAATGLIIAISMYRRGVMQNDFFRLSRRPITIGIAGDSGAGKDTLSHTLSGLFGTHSVVKVSGDDYHRYERGAPIWQVQTHLDPRANDLKTFSENVLALISRKRIAARHYDHGTGRFSSLRRVRHNDVVLLSGLHALYLPQIRNAIDVTVFLDTDEELRHYFKIKRDLDDRGYSRSLVEGMIAKRSEDAAKYVAPQAQNADIVFRLMPVERDRLRDFESLDPGPLKLVVLWRSTTEFPSLARILIGLCGLRLDQQPPDAAGVTQFAIEGQDVLAEDIAFAAGQLAPELDDVLAAEPQWVGGVLGVMQLVILVQLVQAMRRRP